MSDAAHRSERAGAERTRELGILNAVAEALNARGVSTPRGGRWHAMSVQNALARA